jgi:hypothetical protein
VVPTSLALPVRHRKSNRKTVTTQIRLFIPKSNYSIKTDTHGPLYSAIKRVISHTLEHPENIPHSGKK